MTAGEDAYATREHLVPRAHGGSEAAYNMALACERCNFKRRERPLAEQYRRCLMDARSPQVAARPSAWQPPS